MLFDTLHGIRKCHFEEVPHTTRGVPCRLRARRSRDHCTLRRGPTRLANPARLQGPRKLSARPRSRKRVPGRRARGRTPAQEERRTAKLADSRALGKLQQNTSRAQRADEPRSRSGSHASRKRVGACAGPRGAQKVSAARGKFPAARRKVTESGVPGLGKRSSFYQVPGTR